MATIGSTSVALTMQELAEIEAIATKISGAGNATILRLLQEIHRARRIAKDVLMEREAMVSLGGDDPRSDSIWNHARDIIGQISKGG